MAIQPEKPKLSLQSGANLTQLKKDVKKITDGINVQKKKRQEINDQIASYRAKLETMGIHKKAADMAMAYMSWEPEKREGFDIAYAIVREAMGLPVSDDLFAAADEREEEERKRQQQAEADSVFAERREGQVQDVTDRELAEGETVLEGGKPAGDDFDKPVRKDPDTGEDVAPITGDAPPSKKPGKLDPVVDDQRGKDDF